MKQVRSVVHIFKCPWPDCDRTFEKIKSRSAHLKWHGGDYEETDGADGEHGEGSAAGDFDSQDSEGPGPSKRRRTTSRSDDSAETVESEEQTNSQGYFLRQQSRMLTRHALKKMRFVASLQMVYQG